MFGLPETKFRSSLIRHETVSSSPDDDDDCHHHHHHYCIVLLSQVFFPWNFSSRANGEPHHSGFKSQIVALSL
jgi:hypothetical protein